MRPKPTRLSRDGEVVHVSSFARDEVAGAVVNLLVEGVDNLRDDLVAKGVSIELEHTDQTWEGREMHIKAPDGDGLRFVDATS